MASTAEDLGIITEESSNPLGIVTIESQPQPEPKESTSFFSSLLSGLGTAVRAVDVPRQAVLSYAAGEPIKRAAKQVVQPELTLTGRQIVEKQFPAASFSESSWLAANSPARTLLESVVELADPLFLFGGGAKKPPTIQQAKAMSNLPKIASTKPLHTGIAPGAKPIESITDVAPISSGIGELTEPILKQPIHKNIVKASEELFIDAGLPRDPNKLISDQILDLLTSEKLSLPQLEETLKRNNTSFVELGNELFRPAITDAARRLQTLSVVQRKINSIANTPEARKELDDLLGLAGEIDESVKAANWWRRADNIRRGLLVTQLSTAMRNAETQLGRVGLDVFEKVLDAGLQKVFFGKTTTHPLDGLEVLGKIFSRGTKQEVSEILSAFPRQQDRMFLTYSSDIANKAKATGGITKGVDKIFSQAEDSVAVLNTINRAQEYIFRRGVFAARLDQRLRSQGKDLVKIIQNNEIGAIPEQDVKFAVDQALKFTFAEQPKYGTVAHKFIDFVNSLPGATLAIPFPRFMVNALKFNFEYSPLGVLKLLGKEERAALAAGNTEVVSKAAMGTGMLLAAYQFRKSDHAGERWYEAKLGDGTTFDLRPFNPFASYLFAADVALRWKEGRLYSLDSSDIARGIFSANLRAGTGLAIMDKLMEGLAGVSNPEKALRSVKELAGETVGGLLVPMQQITDLIGQFDAAERIIRQSRAESFWGPLKTKIPTMSETLPPLYSPTKSGPMERKNPLVKQLTGLLQREPKNALEKELDRFQFERREILPSTGEPEVDNLIAKWMGQISEKLAVPFVTTKQYNSLTNEQKSASLQLVMGVVRKQATILARAEAPKLFSKIKMDKLFGERIDRVLREKGVDLNQIAP